MLQSGGGDGGQRLGHRRLRPHAGAVIHY
jgi:hypothetical protein